MLSVIHNYCLTSMLNYFVKIQKQALLFFVRIINCVKCMNLEGTKGKQNKKQKQINLTIQFPKEERKKINALKKEIRRKL